VAATSASSINPVTTAYMRLHWADGFPPVSASLLGEIRWLITRPAALFESHGQGYLAYPAAALYGITVLIGLLVLWRMDWRKALLVGMPLVVALGAAFARKYPFDGRLTLFLLPSLFLALGAAISLLFRALRARSPENAVAVATIATLPALYPLIAQTPVYQINDMKTLLARVNSFRQQGDDFYTFYGAAPAMVYYADDFGISRNDYRVGGCHRDNARRYLEEVDAFRGHRRVWLLIAHDGYHESSTILDYLDKLGSRKQQIIVPSNMVGRHSAPAEAYLFDLSRPRAVSPASFPLRAPRGRFESCTHGPQAMIRPDFPPG
jgi:hypothetical protein